MRESQRPLVAAATLLGIGMGGFADGILFHQVLQLHGMLTARVPKSDVTGVEINMFWDGLFHAFTWLVTAFGLWRLFRVAQQRDVPLPTRTFVGSLALGWGLFNLVEGVIDHHVLHLHHVVERLGPSPYDWLFLASGVLLLGLGWAAIRADAVAPGTRQRLHAAVPHE